MPYRLLWTWDSWLCDPFSADSYVCEYAKFIDFMAEWDYNGLIIWGFIDDRHGGETAAREVASYGNSKGVRIIPGIGAGGYGGFVVSGEHRFNLPTFLKHRPDLRAYSRYKPTEPNSEWLCLYQEDSLKWLRDGAAWLAEEFEIGGVNIETNEMDMIDVCDHATRATQAEPNRLKYAASFSDLAIATPVIYEAVKRFRPDAWITYATYQPMWWERLDDMRLLESIPAECIAQWNTEMAINTQVAPGTRNNISLIHSGGWSYHLASCPPIWAFTQYRCFNPNLVEARDFCLNQHAMGLQGIALGNVGSADMPDNEIAYIAYMAFSRNPELSVEDFSKRFIGDLYGAEAEPIVLKLILEQPAVHTRIAGIWRSWADLLRGHFPVHPLRAGKGELQLLNGQIHLAESARELAHESGRKRLDTILQVLREYRIIFELSQNSAVTRLLDKTLKQEGEFKQDIIKVAEIARDAGLPESIYGYGRWLKAEF